MARELYNAKVESDTKDRLKQLTEKYKADGLIHLDGDILDIAADLLERNLSIQTSRAVIGIEELEEKQELKNQLLEQSDKIKELTVSQWTWLSLLVNKDFAMFSY